MMREFLGKREREERDEWRKKVVTEKREEEIKMERKRRGEREVL